jgi:4-alpha-glucanotransferase
MIFPRSSGILLHISSLPSAFGIGDLGRNAHEFVDFLVESGQKIWQVLPLSPTGYGDSPYQCFSAFAGNPLFLDPVQLQEAGRLQPQDLASASHLDSDFVDYGRVISSKQALLRKAAQSFFTNTYDPDLEAFTTFCKDNEAWLDDYALFMAAKDYHKGAVWTEWDAGLRQRDPSALQQWGQELSSEIQTQKFAQFEFFRQWASLKNRCHQRGIRMMGDIPIYVAHDSADVWSHPELFQLDERGRPAVVAGVPPDYFSATGQLWGNPIYRWDVLARWGYRWWIDRFRASLKIFDMVRLDHFRGFEAYWEIPGGSSVAMHGKWVKGPGRDLFKVLQAELGEFPVVAENLGVITPEVEAIRREFGFPGMSLLQFAFGNDPQGPSFRPHNYTRDLAAYTGGHDNDTTVGWWTSAGVGESIRTAEDICKEHEFAKTYLGFENEPINWVLIRTVLASIATIAIVPLQDVLGLGSAARMNLPGTISGNWKWRFRADALTPQIQRRLRELTLTYDR